MSNPLTKWTKCDRQIATLLLQYVAQGLRGALYYDKVPAKLKTWLTTLEDAGLVELSSTGPGRFVVYLTDAGRAAVAEAGKEKVR